MEEMKPSRPIGIAILSWLHIIGGVVGGIVMLFLVSQLANPKVQELLAAMGIPPVVLVSAIGLIFTLAVASGIGMWMGRPWGWYLGSFYYVYSIVRSVNAFATVPFIMGAMPPDEVGQMSHGPAFYYVKFGGRAIVHLLIYLYFFKSNVRSYFGLSEVKRWKPVVVQVGICVGIVVLATLAVRFAG